MFSLTSTYSLRNILLCGILILLYNAECGTGPPTTESTETTTTGLTETTTTGSTDTSPTSPPVHSCASSPCRDNATCVEIFQSYTCDCDFNFYYDYTDDSCKEGKSFGGELTMKIEFDPAMTNKKSEVYMALEKNVTNIFNKSFSNIEGYEETKILEVRKGSVITTLFNTFTMSAQVNESMIQEAMENNGFYSFTSVYGCNLKKCDPYTTISCYQPPHGLAVCICRDGFFRNERYDTKCQESCIAQCKGENEYLVRDGDKCDCKCQAGYKRRDDKCESCPFGYGGIDCNDAFQLSTVVIGVIAGVIIISMTIGLIYTSIRLKDAKYDEGQPLVNEAKEGSPTMIPRINMGNNPMMMNSLTRDNDEKSYQKGWNTYDNPTMENEYSRKRYY
ncbi:mucin-13-like isoform X2 [Chiloscyllium plagiosum]|uniref:mucin-13-like isoform X2 n=1 Tax=Chiloscyllium plagiosum TaxID=36176 RepID=UPI001CB856B8|nr:mucin-13-like isoform X2 [Chiloscyllium plagiosum]